MEGEGRFTIADIRTLERKQRGLCACGCGRHLDLGYHIDHIVPRAKGGTHWPSNLQLLAPICNLRKCAKEIPPGVRIMPGTNRRQGRQKTAEMLRTRLRELGVYT